MGCLPHSEMTLSKPMNAGPGLDPPSVTMLCSALGMSGHRWSIWKAGDWIADRTRRSIHQLGSSCRDLAFGVGVCSRQLKRPSDQRVVIPLD